MISHNAPNREKVHQQRRSFQKHLDVFGHQNAGESEAITRIAARRPQTKTGVTEI